MRKFSHIRPNVWLLGCLTGWLALSVLTHAAAADWKPAPSPLMTRWGQAVTPDNAWREYPRPQMVRAEWQSLNGLWDYAVVGKAGEWTSPNVENAAFDPLNQTPPAVPTEWNGKILVPFAIESALSGVGQLVRPNQLLWYQRSFDVPEKWRGQRVLLHFDAVDWHAVVWVNGRKMGENKGGYNAFSFDVTDALQPAGSQVIQVAVWDPSNAGDQAVGKQTLPEIKKGFRYTPTTGIWQPVWLEPVPAVAIDKLVITPQVDQGAVAITVQAANAGSNPSPSAKLQIFDGDKVVAEGTGKPGEKIRVKIPNAKLWSPESPFLYDLKVSLGADVITSYFGMRQIEIRPDATGLARLQLNGREIFSFGPLDQGYWPDGVLTPPSDAAEQADLQYLKDIGCNMVRLHIKVNPARWYYWADRLGLMVWQDFVCLPKYGSTIRPSSSAQWQSEMAREMDQLHNHPAIVQWIVFNEAWGQHDTERFTQWTRQRDPSRVVCGVTGWTDAGVGDTYDIHDYSFNLSIARPGQLGTRAMSVGECGGFNVGLPGHLWGNYPAKETVDEIGEGGRESYRDAATWEKRYASWLESIQFLRSLGLCAAVNTQISDVEHECNGWLTYDRAVSKIPVAKLQELHARLYQPLPGLKPLLPLSAADQPAKGFQDHRLSLPTERSFKLEKLPAAVLIRMDGSGTGRLTLNGQLVKVMNNSDRAGYVPTSMALLSPNALQAFRVGDNVLKIEHGANKKNADGADETPLDVGLFEIEPAR